MHRIPVLVQMPVHSLLGGPLTYLSEQALAPGTLVRVPFGTRETLGLVWAPASATEAGHAPSVPDDKLRPIAGVLQGIAPLSAHWQQLVTFAAHYYQHSAGEVALAALPPQLRDVSTLQLARKLKRHAKQAAHSDNAESAAAAASASASASASTSTSTSASASASTATQQTDTTKKVALTPEQTGAIALIDQKTAAPKPFLLFGATGSGKTEVYLQCVAHALAGDPLAQAIVMVPEINLTPQLEERVRARFEPLYGDTAVVCMHSGMTPAQRLKNWLAAHTGTARIVLGTRLAVFASLQKLVMVVIDEEHDPSYKQQEGARYSARDLAIYRGQLEGAKVILGSATPSLESWHNSRPAAEGGRFTRILMPSRISAPALANASNPSGAPTDSGDAKATLSTSTSAPAIHPPSATAGALPLVRRVDMNHQPSKAVFSPPLLQAIAERAARGEQSMVFLNRRGYAPVLACNACDWRSQCPHCSAFRVFHKIDRTLRCHHCGYTEPVPRACPECGNVDIAPMGRGTERLEEHLIELLTDVRRPGTESPEHPQGLPLRIARIDADSTRIKGELAQQLAKVHAGEVDVLVGTQMIAKGHDFRRITLVAAVNPDGALFSSDFRAPERLFCLLMQAAGRSGRDAGMSATSEMWIQTFQPRHPLFEALKRHDYPAFAHQQLQERKAAGMPPFSFQALMRAEARTQDIAQGYLAAASDAGRDLPDAPYVSLYPPVPMSIQRIANIERAQMLVESPSRAHLQRFLTQWQSVLHATRKTPAGKGLIRWMVDVDPLAI